MTPLGQKLRELRIAQGMTQLELASRAEVSHALISGLEIGRRRYITARDVELLALGLGVPEDELWKAIPGGKREDRYIAMAGR